MQVRYSLIPLSSRLLLRYELYENYDTKLNESFFFFYFLAFSSFNFASASNLAFNDLKFPLFKII